ncbi:MAG: AmmeMemoRadiSam system protein A [Eubacteriales bacterium]|nr:AmmeMemoRadiSam system protein A [Eubacteriales bacterium]
MGELISAYIMPHPPIVVPEVGNGREMAARSTLEGCRRVAAKIAADKPDTIIVISPHAPLFQDYIYMSELPTLEGSLEQFGAPEVSFSFTNDIDLVNRISFEAGQQGIPAGGLNNKDRKRFNISGRLDHGVLVPLYFVSNEYRGFKLVQIALSDMSFYDLYKFGMCIRKGIKESAGNTVLLASGDLSHKLSEDAPYGFSKRAAEFDSAIIKAVNNSDPMSLVEMEKDLYESAGECGLRAFIIMYGALDGYILEPEVYSYEGPFGVGYCTAKIKICGYNPENSLYEEMLSGCKDKMMRIRETEDEYVSLARNALETYVLGQGVIKKPKGLPAEMHEWRAGVFVSIKRNGQLRGCIGTISPVKGSLGEEIIANSISAGTGDPRFSPVEKEELNSLVYSVDVLTDAEPIESAEQLDTKKYGVIVKSGFRSGLLLPDLEGVETVEQQLEIVLRKAGIKANENYKMERFEVIRHA